MDFTLHGTYFSHTFYSCDGCDGHGLLHHPLQALDAKAERRAARAERQKLRQKKAWRGWGHGNLGCERW